MHGRVEEGTHGPGMLVGRDSIGHSESVTLLDPCKDGHASAGGGCGGRIRSVCVCVRTAVCLRQRERVCGHVFVCESACVRLSARLCVIAQVRAGEPVRRRV